MREQTLLLNATFEPLKVVPWQRAMTLWAEDKVEIVETHTRETKTPRFTFRIPSVVRLKHYVRNRARVLVPFTRTNLYLRDGHACQYCDEQFHPRDLTFDHVVPVSKGGTGGWENVVTACRPCNAKKADRTPDEAGMRLRHKPRRPPALPTLRVGVGRHTAPTSWHDYLFLNAAEAV